ncbi:hypothetical protein [Cellulomonas endometrii]|uniref:hypothetical protein n=1 Tax=Cellulomonas endometrii TaxID=3036301 RepID=UPI0024AD094F|nr:hypothetical protein [Cellulomonas endometrii]
MTAPTPAAARPPLRVLATGVLVAALALAGLVTVAPAASAAASVTVTGPSGGASTPADGPSTLRVSGSGFQSVPGGLGGIYVMFGWVDDPAGGSWRPSSGGLTGEDYRYVPDSESASNEGHQKFVAFPGSDTEGAANGGVLAADGTWATELSIPGPRFTAQDRSGATTQVDCTQVQCGVITIGAHGVKNATNETFTPVSFGAGPGAGAGAPAAAGTAGAAAGTPEAAVTERAPATLGVDQATAVQGRAMTFAAQGFEPGEQVVATLDSGVVSVGPLTAGAHGEVAGILQLPADLRVGTHVLTLTGAQSGQVPQVEVTVTRDPAEATAADLVAAATPDDDAVLLGLDAAETAVAAAGALLLLVVLASFVTAQRRRRAARRAAGPRGTPATPPPARPPVAATTATTAGATR